MLFDYPNNWTDLVEPVEVAQQALEIIRSGQAVAFIGSGVSKGCYPAWEESVKVLCKACQVKPPQASDSEEDISPDELMLKSDECKKNNKELYYQVLKELFGYIHNQPRRTYDLIIKLPFKSFVTVNIDPLLADKYRFFKEKLKLYVYPELKSTYLDRGGVYYIHGMINPYEDSTQHIVFSKSEFDEAYGDVSLLPGFLKELFTYYNIIFIGCGLREDKLSYIMKVAKEIREKKLRFKNRDTCKHFIILSMKIDKVGNRLLHKEQVETIYYQDLGIDVIRYNPLDENHTGLDIILENWCKLINTDFPSLWEEK